MVDGNALLSIVIPVFNCRRYLSKCLDSVVNQKYRAIEVLLIDDGSNDGSSEICDDYSAKDGRIRVYHIDNAGVSNARNIGIIESCGDYITFLDSDDWVDEEGYFRCMRAIADKQLDIVAFDSTYYYEDSKRLEEKRLFKGQGLFYCVRPNRVFEDFFLKSAWVTNKIFKTQTIKDFRFDTTKKIGEDVWFLFEVLSKNGQIKCANMAYPCYFRRVNDLSATGKAIDENSLNFLETSLSIYQQLQTIGKGYVGIFRICIAIDNIYRKIDLKTSNESYLKKCTEIARATSCLDRLRFVLSKRVAFAFKVRFISVLMSYKIRLRHISKRRKK